MAGAFIGKSRAFQQHRATEIAVRCHEVVGGELVLAPARVAL